MILKKSYYVLIISALMGWGALYAETEAPEITRPSINLTPEKIQQLQEKFDAFIANREKLNSSQDKRALPIPAAFGGWWQDITRGNVLGFGEVRYGTATSDIDSFIFIDIDTFASMGFAQVTTLAGTPYLPRELTNLDYGTTQSPLPFFFSLYYVASPTELVSILDLDGPLFDPTFGTGGSAWSLKLQADPTSLCACFDSRPDDVGLITVSGFYRKIEEPQQPIRPFDDTNSAFPDVTNPVAMAQYIYNAWTLNHLDAQNINFNDQDYKTFYEREAIFAQMLDEGFTFTTPIRRIRVSRPGTHYLLNFGLGDPNSGMHSNDILTDIFTDGFSYATTGATVTISGFEGPWARLNGTYVNGVATLEEGAVPNPSPTHLDINEDQTRGTFRNVFNHFLLDFDSSTMPHDEQGWGLGICGNPTVTVTHRIIPDTEYPAFFAAMQSMFYQMYQVSQHTGRFTGRFAPGSMFLFDTFQEMKDNVAIDNVWGSPSFPGSTLIQSRSNQSYPSGFYNNPVLGARGATTYNDPFGLTQEPSSTYNYNIVMANYLDQSSIRNLYWAIAGTPDLTPVAPNGEPLQFDPVTIGYKPAVPGPQRAEFVGALGNVTVVNGIPQPQFPSIDPSGTYYSLLADTNLPAVDDTFLSNAYYAGIIDPALTGGVKVGYFRWVDEGAMDPGLFMPYAIFPPDAAQLPPSQGGTNLKYGREAMSQVFSQYTRYFNQQNCNTVIIDLRANNGGFLENIFCIAEFFGDDRAAFYQRWSKKDNGNSNLIDLSNTTDFTFFNEAQAGLSASFARFYVQQNATTYGADTIFRGTANNPKKVIILTDQGAASAGDGIPHFFMGENLDGNLGSFTTAVIIGDIDGRLKGQATNNNPPPVSEFSNQLYDANGDPYPPIRYTADKAVGMLYNGVTTIPYNIQSDLIAPSAAPTLKGTAGGNPLPNDWSTNTWPALGFIPPYPGLFDARIPKGLPVANVPETARDPWLEQCILLAVYGNN